MRSSRATRRLLRDIRIRRRSISATKKAGTAIPVTITNQLSTFLGLAPGKYAFGVTLDSGEQQSVDFEVAPGR